MGICPARETKTSKSEKQGSQKDKPKIKKVYDPVKKQSIISEKIVKDLNN